MRLLVWFRRTQPPVHSGWTTIQYTFPRRWLAPSLFCLLISSESCPFSWFIYSNLSRQMLLSSDGFLPIFPSARSHVPHRSLRPRFSCVSNNWFACRCDLSSPSLCLSRSQIADFTFIVVSLHSCYPSRRHTFFLFVLEGGVLRDD